MSRDYPEYTGEVVAEIRGVELCRDAFGAYFWNGGQRPTGVFALKNYQRDPGRLPPRFERVVEARPPPRVFLNHRRGFSQRRRLRETLTRR